MAHTLVKSQLLVTPIPEKFGNYWPAHAHTDAYTYLSSKKQNLQTCWWHSVPGGVMQVAEGEQSSTL